MHFSITPNELNTTLCYLIRHYKFMLQKLLLKICFHDLIDRSSSYNTEFSCRSNADRRRTWQKKGIDEDGLVSFVFYSSLCQDEVVTEFAGSIHEHDRPSLAVQMMHMLPGKLAVPTRPARHRNEPMGLGLGRPMHHVGWLIRNEHGVGRATLGSGQGQARPLEHL